MRGKAGHAYFPRNDIPTWTECVSLFKEQRDHHLRRAASALRRLETELEAVRNHITEAREHPQQTLGIDMMSFGHWPYGRMGSTLRGQPLITGVLVQSTTERMAITRRASKRPAYRASGRCGLQWAGGESACSALPATRGRGIFESPEVRHGPEIPR
ncbi:hypothetical protein [Mycobacterium sp. NAZ190054]|uniref:hypothetical protein n=1 Tax=Mycobacterium sp. NAZ190054 TaxID=1747766 RepID=UPI000A709249|nr:hypothetical protein [Mycobacterium sp. NAZ190054]